MDNAIALFTNLSFKQAQNFCTYLQKHRPRIVDYGDFQKQQLSSIGSGAVESAVKQIDSYAQTFRGSVEDGKCFWDASTALCLPQWSTGYLNCWRELSPPFFQRDYHSCLKTEPVGERLLVFLHALGCTQTLFRISLPDFYFLWRFW